MKNIWVIWLSLMAAPLLSAGIKSLKIRPSETDAAIKTFNDAHTVLWNPAANADTTKAQPAAANRLLVFLPGTGGDGAAASTFCEYAAGLGYRVIMLVYPNEISASICRNDGDERGFERFRLAVIEGGDSKHITIVRTECIEHRLIKLLAFLNEKQPKENWRQFLNTESGLRWETIAVAGQSQGGGHAALIGIKHRVARVIGTGAPKDFNQKLNATAAWYQLESATPKSAFFMFNHAKDPKGCTPEELAQNMKALGLGKFAAAVDVIHQAPPYNHTRMLWTTLPKVTVPDAKSDGAKKAHNAPLSAALASKHEAVWHYMLTEPVE